MVEILKEKPVETIKEVPVYVKVRARRAPGARAAPTRLSESVSDRRLTDIEGPAGAVEEAPAHVEAGARGAVAAQSRLRQVGRDRVSGGDDDSARARGGVAGEGRGGQAGQRSPPGLRAGLRVAADAEWRPE